MVMSVIHVSTFHFLTAPNTTLLATQQPSCFSNRCLKYDLPRLRIPDMPYGVQRALPENRDLEPKQVPHQTFPVHSHCLYGFSTSVQLPRHLYTASSQGVNQFTAAPFFRQLSKKHGN